MKPWNISDKYALISPSGESAVADSRVPFWGGETEARDAE